MNFFPIPNRFHPTDRNKDFQSTLKVFIKSAPFFSLALSLLVLPFFVFSQETNVKTKIEGIVIGTDKVPIDGATIKVKGKAVQPTQSKEKGIFSIQASIGDILLVTHSSFNPQEVKVDKTTDLYIILSEKVSIQNEVVVIAYGKAKRNQLIQPPSKVDVEDLKKAPVPTFDQALQGRVAGVQVVSQDGQPGSQSNIIIRGGSASQESSPLYVVDGFPIENLDINSINPNDIESLEVLKDASSVAIYGSRGANGVILITTRRGMVGKPVFTYNVSESNSINRKRLDVLSPYEYVKLQLENDSILSTPTTTVVTNSLLYLNDTTSLEAYRYKKPINWTDLVMRNGLIQTHTLGLTGGTPDTKYYLSGSYYDQQGVIINTGLKRLEGKFNLDQKINDNLKMGFSLTHSNSTNFGNVSNGVGGGAAVVFSMLTYRPVFGVGRDYLLNQVVDTTLYSNYLNGLTTSIGDLTINPYLQAINEYRQNNTKTNHLNGYADFKIRDFNSAKTQSLSFKVNGGYSSTMNSIKVFYNSSSQSGFSVTNNNGQQSNTKGINGGYSNVQTYNILNENLLTYTDMRNPNRQLTVIAGATGQYGRSNAISVTVNNIPKEVEYLGYNSIQSGLPSTVYVQTSHNLLMSFLGRVNYNLNKRYLFQASLRNDGSSKFYPGNQWGVFPSLAVGWRLLREPWMQKYRLDRYLSELKFRASYGVVGNNRVGDFSGYSVYGSTQASRGYSLDNNSFTQGLTPYFLGNNQLSWEKLREFDFGVNVVEAADRVSVDIDYYHRITDGLLITATEPANAGFGSNQQYQNIGALLNKGLELSITSTNIKRPNFKWMTNFNISFNVSRLNNFSNTGDVKSTPGLTNTTTALWIAKKGQPVSQFYGLKWDGVYQYSDFNLMPDGSYQLKPGIAAYSPTQQPGDAKFQDINGDGVVDLNDQMVIGNPLPIHTGGISNTFTFYKDFNLSILFSWSYGNEVMNGTRSVMETGGTGNFVNQFASYANRWSPTNPSNDIPTQRYNLKADGPILRNPVSSKFVEDGSFIRLKTISFSYNFNEKIMKRIPVFKSCRAGISAQNLWLITKYSGFDPEVSSYRGANPANVPPGVSGTANSAVGGVGYLYIQPSSGNPSLARGLDYTAYPRAVILNANLTVTF